MSWESTVTYYQVMNETVKRLLGGLHSARILINSIDFDETAAAQDRDDWAFCERQMIDAAEALERAGADMILIGANTMHICVPAMEKQLQVPILHIAEAAAARLKKDHIGKTALLGTKYTMCGDFCRKKIEEAGIEVMIPEKDINVINSIIYDELCLGIFRPESKEKLLGIIEELREQGAQGVILGCTELGLLVSQKDTDLPVYDTTLIHAEEAVYAALKE